MFEANNHTFKECISYFYDVAPNLISGGPAWINTDKFLITAKLPQGVSPPIEELKRMFQELLADRFRLKVHREKRAVPVYSLLVAKKGLQMKQSVSPGTSSLGIGPGIIRGRDATISGLAAFLQRLVMDRPVIDKTEAPGKYNFDLIWRPDQSQFGGTAPAAGFEERPDLYTALGQLGLRLEPGRDFADVLVIDFVGRPDDN